jgi:aerobic carbon-monoxide dehydrogenase large subunit
MDRATVGRHAKPSSRSSPPCARRWETFLISRALDHHVSKRTRPSLVTSSTKQVARPKPLFGRPIKRVEDRQFITGNATFIGDVRPSGLLHAAFVRSPHAHARITRIDVSEARKLPGVSYVFTGADIEGRVKPLLEPGRDDDDEEAVGEGGERRSEEEEDDDEEWGSNASGITWRALATETVNYSGEAVAMVVADDPYTAEDGAELVVVEYDPLPAVIDPEAALKPDSPNVHDYLPSNLASHSSVEAGDIEKAFKKADEVVKFKLYNQRLSPAPIEPRGIVASFDAGTGVLTVHLSTQDPHGARDELADILSMARETVRVIAPEVGGAFGGKAGIYPEDPVVSHAARFLHRPVRWVESRRENLMTMRQGRGQVQFGELAMSRGGRIFGLRVRIISDGGAYGGEAQLAEITLKMCPGVYDIPNLKADADVVLTNKVPQGAYRGAGRPEASYLIERGINIASSRLRLDPVKVRRLNYIKKERFPFKTSGGHTYDSGDYHANLDKALALSKYDELVAERARGQAEGRLIGVGLATWVEVCSFGPTWPQAASMVVTEEGRVLLNLGGHSHGQGHATTFAQVVADELGVAIEDIVAQDGDTAMLPWSSVTAGSRSAALSGSAALVCARKIREKMSLVAAYQMGSGSSATSGSSLATTSAKLIFSEGMIYREDRPSKRLKFADVAKAAYGTWGVPPGMEPTLFAYSVYAPRSDAFPFGTHVAMVEVDGESGSIKLLNYFAVDDGGRIINPLVVEGQIHGGVVQGIGQALTENVVFSEDGQPLTSTFADYLIPSAEMLPPIVWDRTETPTSANLLGVKGLGEAGTIAATPTIMNAIEDALSSYGVVVDRMPASPDYVMSLIREKRKKKSLG